MSNIYHTEPPTQGKVLLKTSYGDIDIELWSKEAPLACRNFIQLALEGFYDGSVIHRIIKGFMAQMGDPTGTGLGGDSIWGKPFKDEVHGRIKFNHRGQVAMANENKPHSNRSQFFISLDACEWLNGKHTIFGKVTGSTIFNVLRMGEAEVGPDDRPLEPIKLLKVDVLWNPFDDIIPRDINKKIDQATSFVPTSAKSERKAVRNSQLLSFGDDEEEPAFVKSKIHSSHDSKFKDKKLSSKAPSLLQDDTRPAAQALGSSSGSGRERQETEEDFDAYMRAQTLQRQNRAATDQPPSDKVSGASGAVLDRVSEKSNRSRVESSHEDEEDDEEVDERNMRRLVAGGAQSARTADLKVKTAEFAKLREGLLRSRRAVNVLTGSEADSLRQETAFKEMISPLEQRRAKYMKRKNEFGNRSEETLAKLQRFTESIRSAKKSHSSSSDGNSQAVKERSTESYHGQVLEQGSSGDEDDDRDWHQGKLRFKKHIDDKYRLGADKTNEFTVYDPRAV